MKIKSIDLFPKIQPDDERLRKFHKLLAEKKKLYQISAIFPLQLFPDQLIIDTQKITLIYNQLLGEVRETILIDQIGDLDLTLGPLFRSLNILSISHGKQWLKISQLRRDQALRAKRIIEGLIIARRGNIELDDSDQKLTNELEILGSVNKV